MLNSTKLRPYSQLPGILKAAARARWGNAAMGDGYLYRSKNGALIERIPDTLSGSVAEIIDPSNVLEWK